MPIMTRTSGGIYTPVTNIYDAQGNAISTVYDNAGNTVFSSGPSETERLVFKYTSNSIVDILSRQNTVAAGGYLNINSNTIVAPLCQLITGKYPILPLREYKGWKLRGSIQIISSSNAKPKIEVKIGLTEFSQLNTYLQGYFYSLLNLGTFQANNTQSIDLELPDLANYYNDNLAIYIGYYSVAWTNSTSKSQTVKCGVDLDTNTPLKLYKT